jgi:hypothetical protein
MFSRLKDFVEENSVEISDIGIDHMVNLQCRFSWYFPEAVSDKYKWITDPVNADSLRNYDFSLKEEENDIDIVFDTSLHFSFLGSRT